jgi:hypothetical protein
VNIPDDEVIKRIETVLGTLKIPYHTELKHKKESGFVPKRMTPFWGIITIVHFGRSIFVENSVFVNKKYHTKVYSEISGMADSAEMMYLLDQLTNALV